MWEKRKQHPFCKPEKKRGGNPTGTKPTIGLPPSIGLVYPSRGGRGTSLSLCSCTCRSVSWWCVHLGLGPLFPNQPTLMGEISAVSSPLLLPAREGTSNWHNCMLFPLLPKGEKVKFKTINYYTDENGEVLTRTTVPKSLVSRLSSLVYISANRRVGRTETGRRF